MKRNKLTYRFLPLLSVFILVLFTFTTSCFADYDYSYKDKEYILKGDFPFDYYVFGRNLNDNYFAVYCSNEPFKMISDGSGYYKPDLSVADVYYYNSIYQNFIDLDVSNLDIYQKNPTSFSSFSIFMYSNFDVYVGNSKVFQRTPLPAKGVQLMKPTQVEEIPGQIVGIVKIVLPIFLSIFGILLVLYLIKSKNLLQL